MTRLSDALKKAAAESAAGPIATTEPSAPAPAWQFSAVETMHVPDEPVIAREVDPDLRPAETNAVPPPDFAAATAAVRVGDAERDKLVVGDRIDGSVIEQYRHLAAVLHHAQKSSGVRSVMVTSALPSEGKTLTATNIALTLSQSYQRRVLLIDADLRRPRMREIFALPATDGLTDALINPRRDRLPVHQVTPTLWVLAAGRVLPDPMSMLVSPAMKQILEDAKEAFDWVVVDTPPIAILPDANLLSAMIDTALLVVSAQSTPYPMVQRAVQAVGPRRILGVVLNRAESSGLPSTYYGYPGYQQRPAPSAPKRWFRRLRKSAATEQTHVQ
ncbi:MAG TPA: CpsD/CapB family tyrosine-protein kinase [Vicinamibacterales bacterium]|nr:CpsD/CapB family tyrosine-protein kinase [Vicinamibacterales bacterium]